MKEIKIFGLLFWFKYIFQGCLNLNLCKGEIVEKSLFDSCFYV